MRIAVFCRRPDNSGAQFDGECFPPEGTGGNSPFALYGALSQPIGSVISPAIAAEPKVFAKVLERLKVWLPKAADDYDPGYKFLERKSEAAAHEAVKARRAEFLKYMADLSTLLDDTEYFAAFRAPCGGLQPE